MALYPYYLAMLSLRSSDFRVCESSRSFLQASYSFFFGHNLHVSSSSRSQPKIPSWLNKESAELSKKDRIDDLRRSIREYQVMKGHPVQNLPTQHKENKNELKAIFEATRLQFLALNFENLTIARRLLMEQGVSTTPCLSPEFHSAEIIFLKLPDEVITCIRSRLDLIRTHEYILKRYAMEAESLEAALKDAERLESNSTAVGDLFSQVACLMWNDTDLRSLNKRLEGFTSVETLEAELSAQKAVDSLLADELASKKTKLSRKSRRRKSAALNIDQIAEPTEPTPNDVDTMEPLEDIPAAEAFSTQLFLLDRSVRPFSMATTIDFFASLEKTKHAPQELFQLCESALFAMKKNSAPQVQNIGGFDLPTQLEPGDLITMMAFTSSGTFDRYAKYQARDCYEQAYSGRSHLLQWHLRRHFNSGPEKIHTVDLMLAETFIYAALALSAMPNVECYQVRSSRDSSKKVDKKLHQGWFGIFDEYNRVITFGPDKSWHTQAPNATPRPVADL